MPKKSITQAELKELLDYDPETGIFTWKVSRSRTKSGTAAGRVHPKDKYIQIGIYGAMYMAHRLAWLYVYGEFPPCQIDHIDGNRQDNRISNLRLAPRNALDNGQNIGLYKNNTVGYLGVCLNKNRDMFLARICVNGIRHNLGYFDTAEEAYEARLKAQEKFWSYQAKPREKL